MSRVPPPELLLPAEAVTLAQTGKSPEDYVALHLKVMNLELRGDQQGNVFASMLVQLPPIFKALKPGRILDAQGKAPINAADVSTLVPAVRFVVPYTALDEKAQETLRKHIQAHFATLVGEG